MTASPDTDEPRGAPPWKRWVFPALLIAAGLAVYWNALPASFQFDDHYFIVEDDSLEHLWPIGGRHANRPILTTSLALNRTLGGLDPRGYHATNIAIHLAAVLLLFGLLRRTLGGPRLGEHLAGEADFLAFAVALLWAVHPLSTMAVTYVWQRGESLMGLFFLAVLYAIVRLAQGGKRWLWSAVALLSFFAGLGTKETMVTVLPVAVLFDGALLSPSILAALSRRRWIYGVMTASLVAGAAVVLPGLDTSYDAIGPLRYAASQPGVMLDYLRLACWPDPLCFDYQRPAAYGFWATVPAAMCVGAALIGTAWGLSRGSWMGVCGAWAFLILAPTSSFVPINDLMVEYRMYLPLVGVIALAVGAGRLLCRWAFLPPQVLLALVALALAGLTVGRNRDYLSEEGLWQSVVEIAPDNHRARYMLGVTALRAGDLGRAMDALDEALVLARRHSASVEAGDPARGVNCAALPLDVLGVAFFRLGRAASTPASALGPFERAVELDPTSADFQMNLGITLRTLGERERALECFERSIELRPDYSRPRCNRGLVLLDLGRAPEARAAFDRALALEPGLGAAQYGRARAHLAVDSPAEAREDLEVLLRNADSAQLRSEARRMLERMK